MMTPEKQKQLNSIIFSQARSGMQKMLDSMEKTVEFAVQRGLSYREIREQLEEIEKDIAATQASIQYLIGKEEN